MIVAGAVTAASLMQAPTYEASAWVLVEQKTIFAVVADNALRLFKIDAQGRRLNL